jgi:hypothetical protein
MFYMISWGECGQGSIKGSYKKGYRSKAWEESFKFLRKKKKLEMHVFQMEITKSIVEIKVKRVGNLWIQMDNI